MSVINCKVELKLKCIKHCVFPSAGTEYDDDNSDNSDSITFNIKDTKLYDPLVTLSAKGNKKLSKLFKKGCDRSVY